MENFSKQSSRAMQLLSPRMKKLPMVNMMEVDNNNKANRRQRRIHSTEQNDDIVGSSSSAEFALQISMDENQNHSLSTLKANTKHAQCSHTGQIRFEEVSAMNSEKSGEKIGELTATLSVLPPVNMVDEDEVLGNANNDDFEKSTPNPLNYSPSSSPST